MFENLVIRKKLNEIKGIKSELQKWQEKRHKNYTTKKKRKKKLKPLMIII